MNDRIDTSTPSRNPDDMLTEVVLIVDRSGSMNLIREDMEGGIWNLVLEQHGAPGRCTVTLYTFDDRFEANFVGRPAGEVRHGDCAITPRGSTALFDAVVRGLADTERRVLDMSEDARPELVSVVVVTDGHENASRESRIEDVRAAVARATGELGWTFTFLSADLDGFAQGESFTAGLQGASAQYFRRESTDSTTRTLSADLLRMRRAQRDELRSRRGGRHGEDSSS